MLVCAGDDPTRSLMFGTDVELAPIGLNERGEDEDVALLIFILVGSQVDAALGIPSSPLFGSRVHPVTYSSSTTLYCDY